MSLPLIYYIKHIWRICQYFYNNSFNFSTESTIGIFNSIAFIAFVVLRSPLASIRATVFLDTEPVTLWPASSIIDLKGSLWPVIQKDNCSLLDFSFLIPPH